MSSGKTYSLSGLRGAVDEQEVLFDASAGQFAEKIPAALAHGRRAGALLQLVSRPENRPLGAGIETFGIEQRPLIVIAQQTDLTSHDLIDHFTGVGAVADQIAEAIDLGDILVADVGQHRLKALDVAVDIADEGSFHASRLSDVFLHNLAGARGEG